MLFVGRIIPGTTLILLAVPEEEREQFSAEMDIENMSVRELQKAMKDQNCIIVLTIYGLSSEEGEGGVISLSNFISKRIVLMLIVLIVVATAGMLYSHSSSIAEEEMFLAMDFTIDANTDTGAFLHPCLNFSEMDNKMVKNESFYKACKQTGIY